MSTRVVLALGSNLGDRLANLRAAVAALPGEGVAIDRLSSVWETEPVPADQPRFLNAVLAGTTDVLPQALLPAVKRIERELGRRPTRHWGPRVIDIDILFYGEEAIATDELTIPHPRIAERPFVLAPLAEVLPGRLPVLSRTAAQLLASLERSGLTRTASTLIAPPRDESRIANRES